MNRFKHLLAQNIDDDEDFSVPLFDRSRLLRNVPEQEVSTKRPIQILKLTLRNQYQLLVPISNWVLPDDYTIRLAQAIETIIGDAIKSNNQFLDAMQKGKKERPQLTEHTERPKEISDKLVNDLYNDIQKTIKNQ